MEDVGFTRQWPNCLDEIVNHHLSHQNQMIFDVKPNSSKEYYSSANSSSSSPHQISFPNSTNETHEFGTIKPNEEAVVLPASSNSTTLPSGIFLDFQESFGNQIYEFKACEGSNMNSTKSTRFSGSQEHIMGERKRREKLRQRLIALSGMLPGLKKMDKATILGDAINYVKQLQEQVKTLEEKASETKSMESVVYVKKCELNTDEPHPEIEARSCDKNVLIRIRSEKRKGVVEKTLAEIEKLHLSVVNSSVIAFGSSVLYITIIAQMDEEFSLTMRGLVKNLHADHVIKTI